VSQVNYKPLVLLSLVLLFVTDVSADSLNAQPGLWKISRSFGTRPGDTVPTFDETRCITPQDLATPDKAFNSNFQFLAFDVAGGAPWMPDDPNRQPCRRIEFSEAVNSVSFKCESGGEYPTRRSGLINFDRPDHYRGHFWIEMENKGPFHPEAPEMTTKGTRVDDCAKSSVH